MRAKARLVRTLLGDEMVSNEVVALIELVKNSYDADATQVWIEISTEGDLITVLDDGHGMSHDTVLGVWTSPATLFKKKAKTSRRGRQLLGNKGIGRFASFRLGNRLKVTSRWLVDPEGDPDVVEQPADSETELVMNWADLTSNDELFLDQVRCEWEKRDPDLFGPDVEFQTGTFLQISELSPDLDWTLERVKTLRDGLARLIQPGDQRDFKIWLHTPFEELNGEVEPPPYLLNPDYFVHAEVDDLGQAVISFKAGEIHEELSIPLYATGSSKRRGRAVRNQQLRLPLCGPFAMELRVWDRDRESIQKMARRHGVETRELRGTLDRMSGVSVYRDGFRVFPYGEAGNDWLRLDLRRVQNPTMRLSNNQVMGFVRISSELNPYLKDQSNREGFIQNQAVADLMDLVMQVIAELEDRRYRLRRIPTLTQNFGLFEGIGLKFLRDAIVTERLQVPDRLKVLFDEQENLLANRMKEVRERYSMYRRLSALGELVDKVLHETSGPVGLIADEANLLEEDLKIIPNMSNMSARAHRIYEQCERASHALQTIKPLSGRSRSKRSKFVLEEVVQRAFELQEKNRCRLEVSKTRHPLVGYEGDVLQLFDNLIRNSVYWTEDAQTSDPVIRVKVTEIPGEHKLKVLFCDNGPGIPEKIREVIFDPYFSRKEGGTGLGLVICGEIAVEHGGSLKLLHDCNELPGACFEITLSTKE